uniref:Niban 1/2/3 domain-containing protein n=1 Tax=Gasterosteus aculeatus aculeatus TaxID=481459 RepID=G3PP92_GASAC
MGASSSGLLDEAKTSSIKGLVDSSFQSFSVFYRQQYSAAYVSHLHQEVESKKEGRGLLLTQKPQPDLEEVLYQGSVKFSCWDEQGKKCRERYTVLRRDYRVEIHENMETFTVGCAAKLVLQPAGGRVFTTEQESRAHLEHTCAGILNGVKEDSSLVVSSPNVPAVYLHLPYMGYTCFLFQQEEERDNFLSALKSCIRHCNLDPWSDPSYESQAYVRALRLYGQDKGCYQSWEMLLGTEEQVLAFQVVEEVLSWLQSQVKSRLKGKRTERIQQWLTMQAAYILVLEQLTASLEALREECRQTASAHQALIRSNLDQITSSHCFLEEKVKVCVLEEAERVCSESVAPYMPSILEVLTENISAGIQRMQHALQTQMDSMHTNGGTEDTNKALSPLHSISLDACHKQVENLTERLVDLKQRFGLSSTQRLVQSAHLEMEKLLDSAVYTLELFLQSSATMQPSQIPVKTKRAKERVLKQLDYDSRVVQRRLYQDALLEITLPALSRKMDGKWLSELQQFEQYIFSDYSSFILVHNVYDDVLRKILIKEIETVVQDAAHKRRNSLSLDPSDLSFSRCSLLEEEPPRSAPASAADASQDSSSSSSSSSAPPGGGKQPPPAGEEGGQAVTTEVCPHLNAEGQTAKLLCPVIVVTPEEDEPAPSAEQPEEEVRLGTEPPLVTKSTTAEPSDEDAADSVANHVGTLDAPANQDPTDPTPASADLPTSTPSSLQATDLHAESAQCATADLSTPDAVTEDTTVPHPGPSASHPPLKMSLGSLSEAIGCTCAAAPVQQAGPEPTDRAVYLTGGVKDNWEVERVEAGDGTPLERIEDEEEETQAGERKQQGDMGDGQTGGVAPSEVCQSTTGSTTELRELEVTVDGDKDSELETKTGKEDEEEGKEKERHAEKEGKREEEEEEALQRPQPMESQPESVAEQPLDSVAIIRGLVTEITEVETIVCPCPNSSHVP